MDFEDTILKYQTLTTKVQTQNQILNSLLNTKEDILYPICFRKSTLLYTKQLSIIKPPIQN